MVHTHDRVVAVGLKKGCSALATYDDVERKFHYRVFHLDALLLNSTSLHRLVIVSLILMPFALITAVSVSGG